MCKGGIVGSEGITDGYLQFHPKCSPAPSYHDVTADSANLQMTKRRAEKRNVSIKREREKKTQISRRNANKQMIRYMSTGWQSVSVLCVRVCVVCMLCVCCVCASVCLLGKYI